MTTHSTAPSSILRRFLGGFLFATLPPRQQLFVALLVRRRKRRLF
jgi:hypothetical protein